MPIYMSFKSVFERNPICILDKCHRHENSESSNGLFDWLNQIVQPIKKPVRTLSIFKSGVCEGCKGDFFQKQT